MPLRNEDYTDRELLLVIKNVAGNDQLASSEDIAQELGYRPDDGVSLSARVASRLAWMASCKPTCPSDCVRHYGYLERVDPRTVGVEDVKALWRMTDLGREIANGKLNATAERLVTGATAGQQVLLVRGLTQTAFGSTFGRSSAVRREFSHQVSRRRRGL